MYEAPFTLIERMVEQSMKAKEDFIEDAVLKACMSCGVKIEIEELIKLLTNDRKQYDKGYVDGVKEFAERLKERFLNLEYRANTTRKTLPVEFVKDQMKWCLHEVSIETIDNLVKEMVGDSE